MSATASKNGSTPREDYVRGGKVSKVTRYGWTVRDEPGEFRMIDKTLIHVDPSYQRPGVESKIKRIAGDWSWVACGVILVAERNGLFYALDGGHRVTSARRRADIRELPCMVFKLSGVEEEAKGFLSCNTERKPVTSLDKFRAMLAAGDADAEAINKIIADSGYVISNHSQGSSRSIKCVAAAMLFYRQNEALFRRVWPLVIELHDGTPIHERIMSAICYIEQKMDSQDLSLTRNPWRTRLLKLGRERTLAAISKAAAFYHSGGPRVWANGVVDALNKGVQNRLEI